MTLVEVGLGFASTFWSAYGDQIIQSVLSGFATKLGEDLYKSMKKTIDVCQNFPLCNKVLTW
jgi:hypothetical protein